MERERQIEEILFEFDLLEEENSYQVKAVLEYLFGWNGELTRESLAEWDEADFEQLYDMASGMRLTREYVPDNIKAYAAAQALPSRVQFGRIVAEESEKLKAPRIHRQYGKYAVPKTIERMYELEAELGREMGLQLGLFMDRNGGRYPCTPPDFIPFASLGCDGIHYCFVTDFGAVTDLENAYIAVVSPMNFGSEIWLAARNIKDFLRIVCTDRSVLFNHFPDVESYLEYIKRRGGQWTEDRSPERDDAVRKLREAFSLDDIPDMADYMPRLREERDRAICIRTLNTVGVVPLSGEAGAGAAGYLSFKLEDAAQLRRMLAQASPETKLAVIRDLQHMYVFPDDGDFFRLCGQLLSELELHHEHIFLRELRDI